jgi:YebC/PmpR family DNA-binding regulatory protein
MGRIFETRKATMFARWDKMSKAFARIGKEITIAVKKGGPNPDSNPSLRRVIQNARAVNMPKDKVESAIKKASGVDTAGYDEIMYEGYGPHGAAILVECATDNIVRTVANIRHHFVKGGGHMGSTNSVAFHFKHMGVFRLNPAGLDAEALELELIDFGLEELGETTSEKSEPQLLLRCAFADFGHLAKALEDRKITPISSELEYIPQTPTELPEGQANSVLRLVDMLEQDEDVQRVFHNLG